MQIEANALLEEEGSEIVFVIPLKGFKEGLGGCDCEVKERNLAMKTGVLRGSEGRIVHRWKWPLKRIRSLAS